MVRHKARLRSARGHRAATAHISGTWAQGLVPSQLQFQNAKSSLGQAEVGGASEGAWLLTPSIRTCTSGSRALSFVRQHSGPA